jgi:hypothetical protein
MRLSPNHSPSPIEQRIAALRERARDLIHAGHVVRGLNALDRINRISVAHSKRRRGGVR